MIQTCDDEWIMNGFRALINSIKFLFSGVPAFLLGFLLSGLMFLIAIVIPIVG